MRATQFITEYRRDKTAQAVGSKLVSALATDRGNVGALSQARTYVDQKTKIGEEIPAEHMNRIVDGILSAIEDQDPTKNKQYTQWMARMYANGGVKLEDLNRGNAVGLYELGKRRRMIKPEHADINRFRTYRDFERALVDNYDLDAIETPQQEANRGKAREVYNDSDVRIIVPEDQEAACYYGQGTTWCTAATRGSNYFSHYNSEGPLYILLPKHPQYEGEKYQLSFPTNQFMNEQDDPVALTDLVTKRFPGTLEFFRGVAPEINDYLTFIPDDKLQPVMNQFSDIIGDLVNDQISDWEAEDDYWYRHLRDSGYVDEDGDIDWERVEADGEGWYDNNYEVQEWNEAIQKVLKMTPDEFKAEAEDLYSRGYLLDSQEVPLTLEHMDQIYAAILRRVLRRTRMEDGGIVRWILEKVYCRRDANGNWKVGVTSEPRRRVGNY